MFLQPRLLSASQGSAGVVLAGVAFVIGLGIGATVGPVTASRSTGEVTSPAKAAGLPGGSTRVAHAAEVLKVIDGDTFEARVHLWPGLFTTTRVRLRGIDAPEMKARCAEERDRADAARETLRAILAEGEVGIAHVTLDKYGGRVVADASTVTTPDVSTAMLKSGLARRYDGGRRQSWCG
jgi:endonuclease YncB( thermonuclease family)